jgi:tellurite resistance protein
MNKEIKHCEENRLKFFPIMMFAIVMGLGGLTIVYQKAHIWLSFPALIGTILSYITLGAFITISIIYMAKYFKYKQAVINEFNHPIRINFFGAISISMLMLAIIFKETHLPLSAFFWYIGAILHFALTMHTISFWINKNQTLDHSNPAWFIPIVGNVLVPVGGVGFANYGILNYFFSVGMFFWIVLFSLILNRIIFHHQLATKFLPTLFIFIAPPAVGFLAYMKLNGHLDAFALVLFNLGLFFTLLVAFMYKKFIKIKFFISWWAFVFPLAAITISSMLMYHHTKDTLLFILSYTLVGIVTLVVAIVGYNTILNIKKQDICIEE